jgi:hypothetical protein
MQVSDQLVQPARSDADNCLAAVLTDPNAQMHSHILCLNMHHTSPNCTVTKILKTCRWQLFFFLFFRAGWLAGQLFPLWYECETWCGSSALSLNWLPTLIPYGNYWRAATAESVAPDEGVTVDDRIGGIGRSIPEIF